MWVLASYTNVEGHDASWHPCWYIHSGGRKRTIEIRYFFFSPQKWLELLPCCSLTSPRSCYSFPSDAVSVQWLDLAVGSRCRVGAEVPFYQCIGLFFSLMSLICFHFHSLHYCLLCGFILPPTQPGLKRKGLPLCILYTSCTFKK